MVRQDFPPHRIVSCVMFEKDGKVLLMRRANTGWFDGGWVLPGGSLESGETPAETAAREAAEECGVAVALEDLNLVHMSYRSFSSAKFVAFIFHVNRWQGEIHIAEPEKCDGLEWFDPEALPEPTFEVDAVAIRAGFANAIPFSHYQEVA